MAEATPSHYHLKIRGDGKRELGPLCISKETAEAEAAIEIEKQRIVTIVGCDANCLGGSRL